MTIDPKLWPLYKEFVAEVTQANMKAWDEHAAYSIECDRPYREAAERWDALPWWRKLLSTGRTWSFQYPAMRLDPFIQSTDMNAFYYWLSQREGFTPS